MINMKYAVDRIEENIAVLENLETKEKKEVELSTLPANIHEQAILLYENNSYIMSEREELSRKALLQEKMQRLKNLKS